MKRGVSGKSSRVVSALGGWFGVSALPCRLTRFQSYAQELEVFGGRVDDQFLGRYRFETLPNFVNLSQVRKSHRRDEGATPRKVDHQAFACELAQCFPDRAAASVQ